MTLYLKDLRIGDCFRFIQDSAPDKKPTYCDTVANRRAPRDLPSTWDAIDIDDLGKSCLLTHLDEPIEILEHYRRSPTPVVLTFGCLRLGDAFEFLYHNGGFASAPPAVLTDFPGNHAFGAPAVWIQCPQNRPDLLGELVRRIPRWDEQDTWVGVPRDNAPKRPLSTPEPVPVPMVPLTLLQQLRIAVIDGITGQACFNRFQWAMCTESLVRTPGGFVSTYGGAGLNEAQVAHARLMWTTVLAERRAQDLARARERVVSVYLDNGEA